MVKQFLLIFKKKVQEARLYVFLVDRDFNLRYYIILIVWIVDSIQAFDEITIDAKCLNVKTDQDFGYFDDVIEYA